MNKEQQNKCPVCQQPVSGSNPEGAKIYHFLCAKSVFDVDKDK